MDAKALAIIEAYCGQSFGERQVNERIQLTYNIGRLTHAPFVRLDAVRVRCETWQYADTFGATEWAEVPLHDVEITDDKRIVVPGGILYAHYTEADITYTVGYTEVPAAIREACAILSSQNVKSTYSLSAYITAEIAELVAPYCGKE